MRYPPLTVKMVLSATLGVTAMLANISASATQIQIYGAWPRLLAKNLGVGIEIDYEENTTPNLTGLQAFINAYRSQLPYEATGSNPAARLILTRGEIECGHPIRT